MIIEGTGNDFVPHLTHNLLKIIFQCLHHTNRFVREGGYFTVTALCTLCNRSDIFQGFVTIDFHFIFFFLIFKIELL